MITGVQKVIVPVEDQQKAMLFWTETMGFEVVTDATYGPERWIEVTPPDRGVQLVLSPRHGESRREVRDQLPHSDLFFTCDDIEQTHRELTERGVEFPQPPVQQHFGWWSMFADPEGTRYALVSGNAAR